LVSVSVDDVREVINVSFAEIPDSKITKMIKRAEVTLELETNKQIDYNNCTDAEKEFITVLAAIYAICYLTGGSAVGLSFSIGDKNVSVLGNAPPLSVLRAELERILKGIKGVYVGRV
jgi:rRNA processing protein Krr1/Pno1